jgi:ATP-dependent Clp protease ATP-binding subunit ClpA
MNQLWKIQFLSLEVSRKDMKVPPFLPEKLTTVHHGVRITDAALVSAAVYSNRYITDRNLPDKAIDLVDEACSALRLQQESKPDSITEVLFLHNVMANIA